MTMLMQPAAPPLVTIVLWLVSLIALVIAVRYVPLAMRRLAVGATAALIVAVILAGVTVYAQPVMDPCWICPYWWCIGCP